MKIHLYRTGDPKVEIIEVEGGLTGASAISLQQWVYTSLDEGKICQLINCERMTEIDGVGMNVLEAFVERGIEVHLFNVESGIMRLLEIAGKQDLLNMIYIYGEPLFEGDIAGKGKMLGKWVKKRRHYRVGISFPVEFKYISEKKETILCKADAVSLSEDGISLNHFRAIEGETRRVVRSQEIEICRHETYHFLFSLEEGSQPLEIAGRCIWQQEIDGELRLGIYFKDVKKEYKEMIRNFIYKVFVHSLIFIPSLHNDISNYVL